MGKDIVPEFVGPATESDHHRRLAPVEL